MCQTEADVLMLTAHSIAQHTTWQARQSMRSTQRSLPLQVLLEIGKICQTEADALLLTAQSIAQHITEALQASRAHAQQAGSDTDEADNVDSSNIADVQGYFAEHHRRARQLRDDDNQHVVQPGMNVSLKLLSWNTCLAIYVLCVCTIVEQKHCNWEILYGSAVCYADPETQSACSGTPSM